MNKLIIFLLFLICISPAVMASNDFIFDNPNTFIMKGTGNLGIGTILPVGLLDVEGTLKPTVFYANGASGSQNVGIGSIKPGQALDVQGTVRINAGTLNLSAITAPSSPNKGDSWNDTSQNMIALYNGNTLYQSGNLYTATAAVTINSITPTTVFSGTNIGSSTIKANTLKVGQKFQIWGSGNYTTPIGNTSTVTITTKIGLTQISTVTTGALPSSATTLPFDFVLNCTVQAIGASAKLVCDGSFNYATALSAVAKTSNSLSTIGQITFDSTADEAMDVQANWSAVTTQTGTVQQAKIDFL